MNPGPVFGRAKYDRHVSKIKRACQWLAISQGRAATYARLVAEFFADGARSQEHVLAYNESCEIVDLFELWQPHVDRFPGLRANLCQVCKKGPTLRESENAATSSNRPRNDAFSYLVSGTLFDVGINVVAVESLRRTDFTGTSDADLSFEAKAAYFDVECKRPQTEGSLVSRMRETRVQLEQPSRERRPGIVALACSTIVRPPGTLLEYESGEKAETQVSSILEGRFGPTLVPHLTSHLLGFILVARVAGMMRLGESLIINPQVHPIHEFRPETILTWHVFSNSNVCGPDILKTLAEKIAWYQASRRRPVANSAQRDAGENL